MTLFGIWAWGLKTLLCAALEDLTLEMGTMLRTGLAMKFSGLLSGQDCRRVSVQRWMWWGRIHLSTLTIQIHIIALLQDFCVDWNGGNSSSWALLAFAKCDFSVLLKLCRLFHVSHRWDSEDLGSLVSLEGLSSSWSSRGSSLQGLLSSQSGHWFWLTVAGECAPGGREAEHCAVGQGAAVCAASCTTGCFGELQASYGFTVQVSKREFNAIYKRKASNLCECFVLPKQVRWQQWCGVFGPQHLCLQFPKQPSHCLASGWGWAEQLCLQHISRCWKSWTAACCAFWR